MIRGHRAKRSPQIFLPSPVQIQNDKESNNHSFDLEFAEIPDRRIKKRGEEGRVDNRRELEHSSSSRRSKWKLPTAAMIFKESPGNGGETNSLTTTTGFFPLPPLTAKIYDNDFTTRWIVS